MPDTAENQAQFPQHDQQESGAGFPIARLVGVISLANGALLDLAMGPYKGKGTGEYGLFRELLECFVEGDVMVADSYYSSYFLIAALLARGVDFVFEQHGARNTDFRAAEKLGGRDHVVKWSRPKVRPQWMTVEEYESYPQELTVRETKIRKKVLVTSFLEPRAVCKGDLGKLFLQRWNAELDLRNIKETPGMGRLSCKTPQMCEKEIGVYMLAYNLIRFADDRGGRASRCIAAPIEFQTYGSGLDSLESTPVPLGRFGGYGRAIQVDRPGARWKSARKD